MPVIPPLPDTRSPEQIARAAEQTELIELARRALHAREGRLYNYIEIADLVTRGVDQVYRYRRGEPMSRIVREKFHRIIQGDNA